MCGWKGGGGRGTRVCRVAMQPLGKVDVEEMRRKLVRCVSFDASRRV